MWISRCLYTSSRASPRWSHAHFSAISLCSPSCLASPCLGLQRLYLDSCSLLVPLPAQINHAQARLHSFSSPSNRRASSSPPSIHSSLPCELHVAAIATNFGSEPLLHLLYLHYTCSQLATYSHTHKHACVYPDTPHLPYQEFLTQEQRNKHRQSLPRRPVLPLPERMASTRHAYMHASMQSKTRAASRAFLYQCAHRPRVPIIIAATRCDRGVQLISCVRRSTELKQRKQKAQTRSLP